MSKFLKASALVLGIILAADGALAEKFGLGRQATADEIAAWDIDVRPDGLGLPKGSGSVEVGEELYTEKCAVCHGDFGEGAGRWPVLAGGQGTLTNDRPVKTVGSYWPYLSTVWDYVHRAMPFGEAQSLSNNEVYAITAYILYLNDLVEDDFTLSRENFGQVRLPNEANFFDDDRKTSPVFSAREVCMADCKPPVKITMRARVLDVTPESEGGSSENEDTRAATALAEPEKPVLDAALVEAGAKVFKKCKACHQVGEGAKNKVGPQLNGIVGASIGAVEGFKYSKALKAKADEGAKWDETALRGFLAKPRAWAKGTKMSFAGLKNAEDQAAVIEYLKSFAE